MAAARNVVHPGNLMHYAAHLERWRDAGDLPGTTVVRAGAAERGLTERPAERPGNAQQGSGPAARMSTWHRPGR